MVQHRGRVSLVGPSRAGPRRRRRRRRRTPFLVALAVLTCVVGGLVAFNAGNSGPPAPTGLTAVDSSAEAISLTWKPVAHADSYQIVVSDRKDMNRRRTFHSDTPSFEISDLDESTRYFVKVRGVVLPRDTEPQIGDFSPVTKVETVEATFAPSIAPLGLEVTSAKPTSLTLGWERTTKAEAYELQYATDVKFSKPKTLEISEPETLIKGLEVDMAWFVRLRAVGPEGAKTPYTEPLAVRTTVPDEEIPLRVASYNIKCHSCGGPAWSVRRRPVATTIAGQSPDVIGLQEAAQSNPRGYSRPQFEDLRALLSDLGPDYRVTESAVDASKGTRILYKPDKVVLLDAGSVRYSNQKPGQTSRHFAWAVFRQRATGQEFFFASTHLQPGKDSRAVSAREAQTRQLVSAIAQINGKKYPTMIVGDFNDYQYARFFVQPYLRSAGFIDPLGVQDGSRMPSAWATAEKRIRTNFDSFNDSQRRAKVKGSDTSVNGTYLDGIFTTTMKVKSFENVLNIDGNGNFIGTIPSDHNMIRADVVLPY